MPEDRSQKSRMKHLVWLILLVAAVVLIGIGVFPKRVQHGRNAPVESRPPAPSAPEHEAAPPAPSSQPPPSSPAPGDAANDSDDASQPPSFFDRDQEIAIRWAQVDLDDVREAMPDNLFWKYGAPTDDPDVLREREEERARQNDAWGQVLSGNASESEIHDYYAQRHRVSSDYVEFASYLLDHYGDVLPARDVGLLEFSVKMHQARLQQMPRRLMEALERKEKQDRLRAAWKADEDAFEQALLEQSQRDASSRDTP